MSSSNRIFFLGMHVVLTQTELPRLRALGYEVFWPPYLSHVYDQSANTCWDSEQPTTLPREVIALLSRTNFFYDTIPHAAAEVLNQYFGTVYVTINPDWLAEVMRVFNGRVIYRTYGQPWTISEALCDRGLLPALHERDDFFILPFAEEACENEHHLVRSRMTFVPYAVTDDVTRRRDTWSPDYGHRKVMVPIPHIDHPYYKAVYNHINTFFPGSYIEVFGVQARPSQDTRVVGTLPRTTQLDRYVQLVGQFYPYHDASVCYLPPIEFMTVGGPVIYVQNSLLRKFFGDAAPGLACSVPEQHRKIELLRNGDKRFIAEVIESQERVRRRYAPEYVWPIFDSTIRHCMATPTSVSPVTLRRPVRRTPMALPDSVATDNSPVNHPRRIYILFHFSPGLVGFSKGKYFSAEGIPRVIQKVVAAVLAETTVDVIVTCYAQDFLHVDGFFSATDSRGRVRIMVVDQENLHDRRLSRYGRLRRWLKSTVRSSRLRAAGYRAQVCELGRQWEIRRLSLPRTVMGIITGGIANVSLRAGFICGRLGYRVTRGCVNCAQSGFLTMERWALAAVREGRKYLRYAHSFLSESSIPYWVNPLALKHGYVRWRRRRALRRFVQHINNDRNKAFVLVPHYYLFEEAVNIKARLVLYLPDFMPHLFRGVTFESGRDDHNTAVGRRLCQRAHTILTASEYSASYLPECALQVDKKKIAVFPLPMLAAENRALTQEEQDDLARELSGKRYLFYPTANRPNKQLSFLLEVMGELLMAGHDVSLVLTCSLNDYRPTQEAYARVNEQLKLRRDKVGKDARCNVDASDVRNPKELAGHSESEAIDLRDRLIFKQGVSDAALQWLYQHAAVLCFTSTMEGNFPPQIFEALYFDTPVVATTLPLITEILGEDNDDLILCKPLDKMAFVTGVLKALARPDLVRERQAVAFAKLLAHSSDERFMIAFGRILRERLGA